MENKTLRLSIDKEKESLNLKKKKKETVYKLRYTHLRKNYSKVQIFIGSEKQIA